MSETFWIALMTGGFTLIAGVVGVLLTHWYTRRQADAARRDDRRKEARVLLAELVHAGTQLGRMHGDLVPAYFKSATDQNFWFEWPDTDSGKLLRQCAGTVDRVSGELRLIVKDRQLLDLLAAALEKIADTDPMQELLEEGKRTGGKGPWDSKIMRGAIRHFKDIERAFQTVETRAAELLRGDL